MLQSVITVIGLVAFFAGFVMIGAASIRSQDDPQGELLSGVGFALLLVAALVLAAILVRTTLSAGS